MRFVIASVMLFCIGAKPAAADLYRWVDPESGSVKFSSDPPPWYGDAAKARRAPKVELIPATKARAASVDTPEAAARPVPPAKAAKDADDLEDKREALLEKIDKGVPR